MRAGGPRARSPLWRTYPRTLGADLDIEAAKDEAFLDAYGKAAVRAGRARFYGLDYSDGPPRLYVSWTDGTEGNYRAARTGSERSAVEARTGRPAPTLAPSTAGTGASAVPNPAAGSLLSFLGPLFGGSIAGATGGSSGPSPLRTPPPPTAPGGASVLVPGADAPATTDTSTDPRGDDTTRRGSKYGSPWPGAPGWSDPVDLLKWIAIAAVAGAALFVVNVALPKG